MNYFFDMVGCRLNQAEIETLAMRYAGRGDVVVSRPEDADVIVVNTCCVTQKAAADSRKMIRKYTRDTRARVIAAGCWATIDPAKAVLLAGGGNVLTNAEKAQLTKPDFIDLGDILEQKPDLGERSRTRGFVKVQDGCMNRCSYCLTTIARGDSVSTPENAIIAYIHKLERLDVREIVLTGVQLGSWGKDLGRHKELSELLAVILKETDVPRVRLSSIEPWDVTPELLEIFSDERMCPHLHIPIQSGSEEILRRMRRPITAGKTLDLLRDIKQAIPGVSLTTDIIAGFPGETDERFEETIQFLQTCPFNGGHVFKFSPMPGTEAANMPDQVRQETSQQRSHRLQEFFRQASQAYQQRRLGSLDSVLVETSRGPLLSGFTRHYRRVYFPGPKNLANTIQNVSLNSIDDQGKLFGKLA